MYVNDYKCVALVVIYTYCAYVKKQTHLEQVDIIISKNQALQI